MPEAQKKYVVMYPNALGYKGMDLFLTKLGDNYRIESSLAAALLFDSPIGAAAAATKFPFATALPAPGHDRAVVREVTVAWEETRRLGRVV